MRPIFRGRHASSTQGTTTALFGLRGDTKNEYETSRDVPEMEVNCPVRSDPRIVLTVPPSTTELSLSLQGELAATVVAAVAESMAKRGFVSSTCDAL